MVPTPHMTRQVCSAIADATSSPERHHSYRLSRVRSKDTRPEKVVRSLLHNISYRYRIHRKDLPGTPDVLFTRRRVALFVHGCFWHRHDCGRASIPKKNFDFWADKFRKTLHRDRRTIGELNGHGWEPIIIWECETRHPDELESRLAERLNPPKLEKVVSNVRK